jgi:hypothetical protein
MGPYLHQRMQELVSIVKEISLRQLTSEDGSPQTNTRQIVKLILNSSNSLFIPLKAGQNRIVPPNSYPLLFELVLVQ